MNTVTEASKLWCPMVRVGVTPASGGPAAVNDPTSIAEFFGWCIGDKCATWRWVPSGKTIREKCVIDRGHGNFQMGHKDVPTKPTHGYCGLAGRPEVMP